MFFLRSTCTRYTQMRFLLPVALLLLPATVVVAAALRPAPIYHVNTHQAITRTAVHRLGALHQALETLELMGRSYPRTGPESPWGPGVETLWDEVEEMNEKLITRLLGNPVTFLDESVFSVIEAGAVLEDAGSLSSTGESGGRFYRHFAEGQMNYAGLSGVFARYVSSIIWGLTGGTFQPGAPTNNFTWQAANQKYAAAFRNSTTKRARLRNEVDMFRSVGHCLHLLQDLYQPSHTRDDLHPGHGVPIAGGSTLETWAGVNVRPVEGGMEAPSVIVAGANNLDPNPRPTFQAYLTDASLDTSTTYFSDDTFPSNPGSPQLPNTSTYTIVPILRNTPSLWSSMLPTGPVAIQYLQANVTPEPDADTTGNPFLGVVVRDGTSVGGRTWTQLAEPYLTDISGQMRGPLLDNAENLIPRATAQSAGVLNHFFRGRMWFYSGLCVRNGTPPGTEGGGVMKEQGASLTVRPGYIGDTCVRAHG